MYYDWYFYESNDQIDIELKKLDVLEFFQSTNLNHLTILYELMIEKKIILNQISPITLYYITSITTIIKNNSFVVNKWKEKFFLKKRKIPVLEQYQFQLLKEY